MMEEYRGRAPYIGYLVKMQQDLLVTSDMVRGAKEGVNRVKCGYEGYYRMAQVAHFVEKREAQIVKYEEKGGGKGNSNWVGNMQFG